MSLSDEMFLLIELNDWVMNRSGRCFLLELFSKTIYEYKKQKNIYLYHILFLFSFVVDSKTQ